MYKPALLPFVETMIEPGQEKTVTTIEATADLSCRAIVIEAKSKECCRIKIFEATEERFVSPELIERSGIMTGRINKGHRREIVVKNISGAPMLFVAALSCGRAVE